MKRETKIHSEPKTLVSRTLILSMNRYYVFRSPSFLLCFQSRYIRSYNEEYTRHPYKPQGQILVRQYLKRSHKFFLFSQRQNKECIVGLKVRDHKALFMVSKKFKFFTHS